MISRRHIACCIILPIFLNGCNKLLEPVSLYARTQGAGTENIQENFDINIKSLTFENAQNANNAPYPRRIINHGIGESANVINESIYLSSDIPSFSKTKMYTLGIGDKLIFKKLNNFESIPTHFPSQPTKPEYLVGIGDELTLIQLNETEGDINAIISNISKTGNSTNNGSTNKSQSNESILETTGVVGSNGNILLLGLGSIKAKGRSLNDLQTEVRNILIRNGLAPSFQLEISGFNSKKAFVIYPNLNKNFGDNIIPITNLPITLKELAINYGLTPSSQNTTIISLTRDGQKFHMTTERLFDKSSPTIFIQDEDQIEIEELNLNYTESELILGSKGNILIPSLGSFKANNRTLNEVQLDISRALREQGLKPNFQLEVTSYNSKFFFLILDNLGSKKIPLSKSTLNLKEAILANIFSGTTFSLNDANLTIVELTRDLRKYNITLEDVLSGDAENIFVQDNDVIKLKKFNYKPGKVFAFSGAGKAQIVEINPSIRETLADILFTSGGALNNLLAKRSEVYLLRGQNPSVAYHLDAQNVSRILVAAKTELRPNDIVYVADRPIISFSRTLSEILPLRLLLRDIQNGNIP